MAAVFKQDGIRFLYPENWTLERGEHDGGWSVTVESRDTAFFTLSYHTDLRDMAALADSALTAFRDEYPVFESEPTLETLAGLPAVGHDVHFVSLDLTNTAWIRALACEEGCILMLCEINDLELEKNGQVLKAICASLKIDD